jgi:hypothetical protein
MEQIGDESSFEGIEMQVENPGEDPERRAIMLAIDEWQDYLQRLPLDDPRRASAAQKIVHLEDRLEAMGG